MFKKRKNVLSELINQFYYSFIYLNLKMSIPKKSNFPFKYQP